jgi:hypothetical protein
VSRLRSSPAQPISHPQGTKSGAHRTENRWPSLAEHRWVNLAERHRLLDTLAAAFAEAADFESAVKWQTTAKELAPFDQHDDVQSRLDLYEQAKPFHEAK